MFVPPVFLVFVGLSGLLIADLHRALPLLSVLVAVVFLFPSVICLWFLICNPVSTQHVLQMTVEVLQGLSLDCHQ